MMTTTALVNGQSGLPSPTSAKSTAESSLCALSHLPSEIQNRLKRDFGSWKFQEPADLGPHAHARWEDEKPLGCPGIAVGQFENGKTPSYAVLLVPHGHPDAGYKFLVFSPQTSQPSYEMRVVDQWDKSGAANYFIHKTSISKFFDERSRKKFHAQSSEGILLVDSAENEYGVEVYFWSGGSYRHEPIDY
jgi:hypothetical protein